MKNLGSYPAVRLRRNRKADWSRRLVSESNLSSNDLIWPIFIRDGKNIKEPLKSMPGVYRYSIDKIESLVEKALYKKIPMIALFPNTPASKKNANGSEALNKNNLICKALRLIKKNYKEIGIMCDVALDPYTNHGHDGILRNNYVDNDETVKILVKQSLLQAEMGCDVIAPSDMMDGRIGEIRKALDKNGYNLTQILSYAVKYASNFYGPFRDAVGSKKMLKSDKKNYQMDTRNFKEALREVSLDISEGADFVMIGSLLAGTEETPGETFFSSKGKKYKVYRGMASADAQNDWRGKSSTPEGISTTVPYKGSATNILKDLAGGIRSGLSYSGVRSLAELRSKATFVRQTHAGQSESSTHILRRN